MTNKKLKRILKKQSGRNAIGRVTTRHQGGREKRFLRKIDFRREKRGIEARVVALEYDPNRGANVALLHYADGEKNYILAPVNLKVGDKVLAGEDASLKVGNALPMRKIPVGTVIHNLELTPGKGGQIVRGAGTGVTIASKEKSQVLVKLPSGEQRLIKEEGYATIGQVSRPELKIRKLRKAGQKRHLGIRPSVRGVAMNPRAHPHGGGEGRSGIGMPSPKSPWGKPTLGKKTRKLRKYSDRLIIKGRKRRS